MTDQIIEIGIDQDLAAEAAAELEDLLSGDRTFGVHDEEKIRDFIDQVNDRYVEDDDPMSFFETPFHVAPFGARSNAEYAREMDVHWRDNLAVVDAAESAYLVPRDKSAEVSVKDKWATEKIDPEEELGREIIKAVKTNA